MVCAGLALTAAALAVFRPAIGWGSETQFWQVGDFGEFLRGNLQGVSLSHDGLLALAPPTDAVFDPEETLALSLAGDPSGRLYVGTGHEGKVFRVDSDGHGKLLFQSSEPEILAIAWGPDGALYAASSPEGKIYRIAADGKSTVFFDPKSKYIWSLVFDHQGQLYAGTGDSGIIYRIDREGKGDKFFESRQTHIICLALDREGNLLAGSDPDGLVFRISPDGKGFVLYKAEFPEVHALALDSEGRIYAAALGGSGGNPATPFFAPQTPAGTEPVAVTTITVTASGGEVPGKEGSKSQQPTPQPAPQRAASTRNPPSFSRSLNSPFAAPNAPQGRGALIRIAPDNSAETLWSSDKESVFGLALEGGNVLFSTDGSGKIFQLSPSPDGPKLTLLTETRESQATRLLVADQGIFVATSNVAKLFRIGTHPAREGAYESPVKDAKFVSQWGNLSWRAQVPAGCALELYSRSGNSESPDPTWSNWAGPYSNPDESHITSPPARYIQWKAVFKGSGASTPQLEDVTLAYLNENLPPQIRSLDVSTAGTRTGVGAGPSPGGNIGQPNFSSPNPSDKKTPTTITWQADDPNGDRLTYGLYLKAADERDWHLVKDRLHESTYTLDPNAVPDGEYLARVVASDEESNPAGGARRSDLISAPFWVDNTPPKVEVMDRHLEGGSAEVRFRATSDLSPMRSAEMSVDGGDWAPVAADDGIVDSRSETFTVHLHALKAGEHRLLLRATDIAGNTGVGKAVLREAASGE
jgi:hypothetical protein